MPVEQPTVKAVGSPQTDASHVHDAEEYEPQEIAVEYAEKVVDADDVNIAISDLFPVVLVCSSYELTIA